MKSVKQITLYSQHIRHNILYIRAFNTATSQSGVAKRVSLSAGRGTFELSNIFEFANEKGRTFVRFSFSYMIFFCSRPRMQKARSGSRGRGPRGEPRDPLRSGRRPSGQVLQMEVQQLRGNPGCDGAAVHLQRQRQHIDVSFTLLRYVESFAKKSFRCSPFVFCRYTPKVDLDYGTLSCSANNDVGHQAVPCMFQLVAAGEHDVI